MKDNKLIAEFMGWKPNEHHWCLNGDKDLQYHTSWDWLMPVVEEIECLIDPNGNAYRFTIDMCNAQIEETNIKILGGAFKLDSTYKAVVEFIKKYNDETEV